jgi:hypothetical protein
LPLSLRLKFTLRVPLPILKAPHVGRGGAGTMGYHALSCLSQETDSGRAGLSVARTIRDGFGKQRLAAVLVYATVNHDQTALLRGLREGLGPGVVVVGCSGQGVMGNGNVLEGGYLVGAMGLGGEGLLAASARVDAVDVEGTAKGQQLAGSLVQQLGRQPKLMVLVYDPLGGVDVNQLLAGARREVSGPIVGGAASQTAGPVPIVGTFQYHGDQVFDHGAVALGLAGDFDVDVGLCHGTTPTGVTMTLTRADGNKLLELDGRPALDVWKEGVGFGKDDVFHQEHSGALALGLERRIVRDGREQVVYLIRNAFGFDTKTKAVVVQAAIPEGSQLMFHHRTVKVVKEGTVAMGQELRARLDGRRAWAVLGFECGGRTTPFLGPEETLDENLALQKAVAPEAPWLGLIAWGEIAPQGGEPEFHNYTYPLVVLSE